MEDLVKLVEAVKLIELEECDGTPDGRIWEEGTGLQPSDSNQEDVNTGIEPSFFLHHASRTSEGLYIVDMDRTK
jgi:hypothetical protein